MGNSINQDQSSLLDGSVPDWVLMSSTGALAGRKKSIRNGKQQAKQRHNNFAQQEEELIKRMSQDNRPNVANYPAEVLSPEQINLGEDDDDRRIEEDVREHVQEIEEDKPSY